MAPEYIPTNVPGFKKDKTTGAVINTNTSDLTSYRKQTQVVLEKNMLAKRVQELEKELADQKRILQVILLEVGILKQ